jgi:hypothetical protein
MKTPHPQVRQGGEAEPVRSWTDDKGLPLVWGLSAPDPDGVRSTHYVDQADVRVVALEPVLDLLEPLVTTRISDPKPTFEAIYALLREHGRLQ